MSEKEKNLNDTEFESRVFEVSDEESTIFGSNVEYKDKVKKGVKAKKIILSATALVLVAALIFGIIKLIPVLNTEQAPPSVFTPELTPRKGELLEDGSEYPLYYDFNKVNRVNLIRDDGIIKFHTIQKETVDYDEQGKEVIKLVDEWALADVDRSLTSYSIIDNTVTSFMDVTYTKKIADDKGDGKLYGFDDPEYQVDFYKTGSDKVWFSLIVGDYNPTNSGRYVTTSLDKGVYYVNGESSFYQFQKTKYDFVQPESVPAITAPSDYSDSHFTDGTLILAEKLDIWGESVGGEYNLITKTNDNITVFNQYHITAPVARPANDDVMGDIVALFSYGIEAEGCYAYSTTEEDLKKVGLDKPDIGVRLYVNDVVCEFIATKQSDGDYAVYYKENKTIMKVSAASLSALQISRKDIFNKLLFIENITAANKITVEEGGEKLEFVISTTYDEESQSDTISSVKLNGKNITALNFQNYYADLIKTAAVSYDEADISEMKPETVLTIHHKNGSAPTVVEYYQISASRYQVVTNGVKMGLISASDHSTIMKYAKNVAAGKTFNAR